MKITIYIIVLVMIVVVAILAYIRLAPTDAARWHRPIAATISADLPGGAIRVRPAGPQALVRADAAARTLPRTRVLAGSVKEGRITYVTRSAVIGFPDYTTVEYRDGRIRMFARLRFGRSDLGVNRERLERLLAAVEG